MKTLLAALAALFCAPQDKSAVVALNAADITWTPAAGAVPGLATALQYGDAEKGPCQLLVKLPANAAVAPHFHKSDEFGTLVSGTMVIGQGETVDDAKGVEVSAGGYFFVPAQTAHWVKARSEVVFTRFSPGPREMTLLKDGAKAPGQAPLNVTPAKDVKWEQSPGMAEGIKTVLQYGDPEKGPYIILLKFPAGTFNPPHWHTADEVVTILSGSIITGEGEAVHDARGKAVGPGGYFLIPGKTAHWGKVPQGDIVLTRLGNGPRDIHYFGAKK